MKKGIHRQVWESLGSEDPDWAVLSEPSMKQGGWNTDFERFYASGRDDVDEVLRHLPDLAFDRALDWGSGTGRLSHALAEHFAVVTCVDVSHSMLATLRSRSVERGVTNLTPVHLDSFVPAGDHDLCLSLLVLQHLPDLPAVAAAIGKMVAAVRIGGYVFVELPSARLTWGARLEPRFRAYRLLRRVGVRPAWLHRWGFSGISMLSASENWTRATFEVAGAEVVEVIEMGASGHYRMNRYVARRVN